MQVATAVIVAGNAVMPVGNHGQNWRQKMASLLSAVRLHPHRKLPNYVLQYATWNAHRITKQQRHLLKQRTNSELIKFKQNEQQQQPLDMQAWHKHTTSTDINLPHARRGCGWSVGAPLPRERHHRKPVGCEAYVYVFSVRGCMWPHTITKCAGKFHLALQVMYCICWCILEGVIQRIPTPRRWLT